MNKKAEEFKAYVEKTRPLAFTIEEIPDDHYETVAFRSFAEVRGNRLPLVDCRCHAHRRKTTSGCRN